MVWLSSYGASSLRKRLTWATSAVWGSGLGSRVPRLLNPEREEDGLSGMPPCLVAATILGFHSKQNARNSACSRVAAPVDDGPLCQVRQLNVIWPVGSSNRSSSCAFSPLHRPLRFGSPVYSARLVGGDTAEG